MSLITLKEGMLAADMSVAVENNKGSNMSMKKEKLFVNEEGTIAFASVGKTVTEVAAKMLLAIFAEDLQQANGRIEFNTKHEKWIKNNKFDYDFNAFIITRDGAWAFRLGLYTVLETETPCAGGTGHWAAMVYMGEGFSAVDSIERVSRLDHTVSEERTYIHQKDLNKFIYEKKK